MSLSFGVTPNYDWPKSGDPHDQIADTIEQIQLIDQLGYNTAWFNQHYLSEGSNFFQSRPVLARATAHVSNTNLGTGIYLLPLHHPVGIAEDFAAIDAMFPGRLRFGTAIGYKPAEFEAFGVDQADRVGRLVDGIRILKKLWTEDDVSYEGKYFSVSNVSIDPKPNNGEGVEILIGANAERSVQRAAELGDGWLISAKTRIPEMTDLSETYRAAAAAGNREMISVTRKAFVAESTQDAVERYAPIMKPYLQAYIDRDATDVQDYVEDLDSQVRDIMTHHLIGSPEDCIERIETMHEQAGVTHVNSSYSTPRLEHESVLESLRLFDEKVVGYFQDEYADLGA